MVYTGKRVSVPLDPPANVSLARPLQLPRSVRASIVPALLAWVTVLAFASPATAVGLGMVAGSAAPPAAPLGLHAALASGVASHSPRTLPASHVTLPGSDPSSLQVVSPALAQQVFTNRTNLLQNWSLVASDPSAAAARFHAQLAITGSTANVTQAPNSAVPAAAPHPASGPVIPTGTVTGFVELSTSHAPLSGVAIQAYSASGQTNCPIKTCAQVTSTTNGSFTVVAPVGADYVQFMLSYNLTNITYCTVYQSLTTNVGIIYMVPEAVLTGTIEANTSSHPKLAGVLVSAVSDDNQVVGVPVGASNGAGTFTAGLPPVPSVVTFSPPFGYASTFLFENATPGEHINIGIVYIQKDPVVKVTFYNAVSKGAIQGTCSPFLPTQCNAITVCSAITPSNCGLQGTAVGTSTVTAVGPAGDDIVKAWATGYVSDTVYIGYVGYNIGTFNFGAIYLMPLGVAKITVDITHNVSSKLPSWATGMVTTSACAIGGLETGGVQINPSTYTVNVTESACTGGCGYPNSAFSIGAIPLRVDIKMAPDTTGNCAPFPTWPIQNYMPVWGNETWFNATSNVITPFYLNLTVGDYVAGNVSVTSGSIPPDFTVTPVAIDNPAWASYPFAKASTAGLSPCNSAFHWLSGSGAFCVAVPPGASKLMVQTSLYPYEQNFTWGAAPNMCCSGSYPMTLRQFTTDKELSINLTALGQVYGHVAQANTGLGVFFAAYTIAAAGTNLAAPTFTGAVALNGTIYSPAPLGWDAVTISASGFAPNTVWVNVTGNESFGTVYLTPLATLAGRVVDQFGNGLLGASVYWCQITQTGTCNNPLGAGLATTDGGYNGSVDGLWLPFSTYEIYATSSGYTADWTWVNATAGAVTIVPTIVLYPATQGSQPAHRLGPHPAATNPNPQTYLRGYLIDNSTGQGLATGGSNIQACNTATLVCYALLPGSNSQGLFNATVPVGTYTMAFTPPGYQPVRKFVNASAGPLQYLGVIQMYPLPWVKGDVQIDPFGILSVPKSFGSTTYVQVPFVPAATAEACNANGSVCGAAIPISTNGSFQVQTPPGTYNKLQVIPTTVSSGPTTNAGYNSNVSFFNASANATTVLNTTLQLPIYVMIGGAVVDNTSVGPNAISPWLYIPGAAVNVATFGPAHAAIVYTSNSGGQYLMFVPPNSANTIVASATLSSVFTTDTVTTYAALPETDPPTVYQMPTLGLVHFGWIQAQVNAANGTPAAFLPAGSLVNIAGGASYNGLGITNAGGHLNLTAPPGLKVLLTIGPGNDFNTTNTTLEVNASATTFAAGGTATSLGTLFAAHWGWVTSAATNSTVSPVSLTVRDLVNQMPLPNALASVVSSDNTYSGTGTDSNWQGQYVADAPIGKADTLTFTRAGAISNNTHLSVGAGSTHVQAVVNLTGVGILAGQVIAYPSNLPVSGATVQTCPYTTSGTFVTSGCYTATTNASGDYWVPAYPGQVSITTSAFGYVQNSTSVAKSCSDCWTSVGPIVLSEFSYITGTVRGLPTGSELVHANVSVCSSVGGNPIGVCDFTVYTDTNGYFKLEAPAGIYNLVANDSGYNASVPLPVTLHPGEVLPIGTLFLEQYGSGQGVVLSQATLLSIANASVFPCAAWSGGGCLPTIQTSSTGTFDLYGPPGTYTLTVSSPGFVVGYASVTLKAGVVSLFSPIVLQPLGSAVYYQISGQVLDASNAGSGIADAHVLAEVNGTPEFTGTTNAQGAFAFEALFGVYNLVATAPGYAPQNESIILHAPVSGLVFQLPLMTYLFSSTVTDGLTGGALGGATISENGSVLGVADSFGAVSFTLANRTHELTASDAASTSVQYAPVTFAIFVSGGPVVHNVQLDPPSAAVHGVIVDALSGVALPGVTVVIKGLTIDGVPQSQTVTTDSSGSFTLTLTQGSYNASASVVGYVGKVVAFTVTPAGTPLNILLTPVAPTQSNHPAPSGASVEWILIAIVGLVALAAVLMALLLAARRPPKDRNPPPGAARGSGGKQ